MSSIDEVPEMSSYMRSLYENPEMTSYMNSLHAAYEARIAKQFSDITKEEFESGRDPSFGTTNPEKFNIEYWNHAVAKDIDPWKARKWFDGHFENGVFCYNRFGRTVTELPDGTTIMIAGEWEDPPDPDFYVYNDVFIFPAGHDKDKDGGDFEFEIYGYPRTVFPPTDFHTATYIPSLNSILIIGNMSSPPEDKALADRGITPVYLLKVGTWEMEKIETGGRGPGLIWRHHAELKAGIVKVTGEDDKAHENCDATKRRIVKDGIEERIKVEKGEMWELDVATMAWK